MAWRTLGDFGVDILIEVAEQLSDEDFQRTCALMRQDLPSADSRTTSCYNAGTLACLPKKATGVDPEGGNFINHLIPDPSL